MKKLLLVYLFALFAITAVSAKDVTIVPGDLTWTAVNDPSYGQGFEVSSDNIFVGIYKYEGGSNILDPGERGHIRFYQQSMILIKDNFGQNITNVELNCIQGNVALLFNDESVSLTDGKYTWSGSTTELRIVHSGGSQVRFDQITVTTEDGGTITLAAPRFTPVEGEYFGTQYVTISAAEGANIYYTTNGDEPTTESTPYTEAIEVAQSMTIKAIAELDGKTSSVATAEYVIETIPTVASIAEFIALEEGAVAMISSDLTMVYQDGSYNYVTDGTDMMLIYGRTGVEYAQGDVIGSVYGRRNTYNGTPQMHLQIVAGDGSSWASDQFTAATENTGAIAPTEISDIATIAAANVNQYVRLAEVAWNSNEKTLSNETGSIAVYNCFSGVELPTDGNYNVTGFVAVYFDNIQIYPTAFEEIADPNFVAAPTFSLEAGTYPEAVEVELACATEGAEIRYTLDGTTPSAESTLYDGSAIVVAETTTISAIAILGENSSEIATATYTIAEPGEGPNINFVGWAFPGADEWTSNYEEHVVNFGFATVTFANANKQKGTITDCPVTKGQDVIVKLNSATDVMTGVTVNLKQWTDKTQTATLLYSTDGEVFEETGTESEEFYLENSTLPEGTVAIKITFSNKSNQVGIASIDLAYESTTTGIDNVEAEGVKAVGLDGGIAIIGEASSVEVYTISGTLVSEGKTSRIDCPAGIYVVKVDGKAQKVIVK